MFINKGLHYCDRTEFMLIKHSVKWINGYEASIAQDANVLAGLKFGIFKVTN